MRVWIFTGKLNDSFELFDKVAIEIVEHMTADTFKDKFISACHSLSIHTGRVFISCPANGLSVMLSISRLPEDDISCSMTVSDNDKMYTVHMSIPDAAEYVSELIVGLY